MFNFRNFQRNISWTIDMNMRVDVVITSQFSINFVHRNDENPIFQQWESKTCLIFTLNKCRIMLALIYFDMGTCFDMLEQKKRRKMSKFYIQNIWENVRRWHHQLTYLHTVITCSRQNQNFISSLFLSDIHLICTVLFTIFYSLFYINLNLDWISPLKHPDETLP